MFRYLVLLLHRDRQRTLAKVVALIAAAGLALHLRAGLPPLVAAYHTLRLFVLDADLAVGAGASPVVLASLWCLRFVAPLVGLGVVAEVVHALGLFHIPTIYLRLGIFADRHVVVVGLAPLGQHMCERLAARRVPVVAIDADPANPAIADLRAQGIPVVVGDGTDPDTLRQARVGSAAHLVALTHHDTVNLDVALAGLAQGARQVWAHTSDETLGARIPAALASDLVARVRVMNSYRWAADELVSQLPASDAALFVIAGYGRFGRALLDALTTRFDAPDARFVVVDPRLPTWWEVEPPWAGCRGAHRILGRPLDMLDPRVLAEARDACCFVCTDDDAKNLLFAVKTTERGGSGHEVRVLTRMFRTRDANAGFALRGVRLVELTALLERSWPDALRELLHPGLAPAEPRPAPVGRRLVL